MLLFKSFWNDLNIFTFEHAEFGILIVISLLITLISWYWRRQDREHIMAILLAQAFALSFLILSNALVNSEFKSLLEGLHEVCIFIIGITFVRLFGLFLFRLILPLFRFNLLRIVEDIVEIIGYVTWIFICLHEAGLNLSSIVTTSAVITGVLAFAMQDTLSNILGGLSLQLDKSINVGDWIEFGDVKGCVSEVHWRFTAIETRNWEMVVIPNSLLLKGKFTVLGRRKNKPLQWRRSINFNISYKYLTGIVIDVVQEAIRDGNVKNVSNNPKANCILTDLNSSLANYTLRYWLTDIEADSSTDSAVRIRIYAALQRAGIEFSEPVQDIYLTHKDDNYEMYQRKRYFEKRMKTLCQIELFKTLNEVERSQIVEKLVYTPFAKGDFIMRQGEIATWLLIIESGSADVLLESSNGDHQLINNTQGPYILGEMGLMTGAPRSATIIAKSDVVAFRLDKESFQEILAKRPQIADEITKILVVRQSIIDDLQKRMDSDAISTLLKQEQRNFLIQIRSFFGLG
jgi:small-conductance mechanosensitive channel/CRP-like cAMP-binding protein